MKDKLSRGQLERRVKWQRTRTPLAHAIKDLVPRSYSTAEITSVHG
jgi:hypothetical protein